MPLMQNWRMLTHILIPKVPTDTLAWRYIFLSGDLLSYFTSAKDQSASSIDSWALQLIVLSMNHSRVVQVYLLQAHKTHSSWSSHGSRIDIPQNRNNTVKAKSLASSARQLALCAKWIKDANRWNHLFLDLMKFVPTRNILNTQG